MNPSPLLEVHRQHVCEGSGATAEFQGYGDVEIVSTFGEPQAEYAAIRKSCGLMDLPQRGVIELSGRDRLSFLNNLAYVLDQRPWWQPGYYAGTFGEYSMAAVLTGNAED